MPELSEPPEPPEPLGPPEPPRPSGVPEPAEPSSPEAATTGGASASAGTAAHAARRSSRADGPRRALGVLALAPAAIALVVSYVVPTLQTVAKSMRAAPSDPDASGFVGAAHYSAVADRFGDAAGVALPIATVPLLLVVVVAPLLAYATRLGGRWARRVVRAGLGVAMVCWSPAAVAIASGEPVRLGDPAAAASEVRGVVWWTTVGVVVAIAASAYLSAMRRRPDGRSALPAVLVTGTVLVAGVLAWTLQMFTYPQVLTQGGPGEPTTTPAVLIYDQATATTQTGQGAAAASLLLAVLATLGVAVTLLLILTRARAEDMTPSRWAPWADRELARMTTWTPAVLSWFLLAAVLAATAYGLRDWLGQLGTSAPDDAPGTATAWLPHLAPALVGVIVAALGGYGIGALRPLGRRSEWLLLPFAPWLFVGIGPLLSHYAGTADRAELPRGMPVWLVVPALVGFTLLFAGLERRRRRTAEDTLRTVIGPAAPLVGIAVVGTWLVYAHDLAWALLSDPNGKTALTWLFSDYTSHSDGYDVSAGMTLPLVVLVPLSILVAAAQVQAVDRFALRVGGRGR